MNFNFSLRSMECMPYFYCRPHDDEVTSIVFDRSYMNFVTSSGDRVYAIICIDIHCG